MEGEDEAHRTLLTDFEVPEHADVSPVIREDDDAITIRRPVHHSVNAAPESRTGLALATVQRLRYYGRLAPHRDSILMMPNHVVPPEFYLVLPFRQAAGNQSSIITIFSIWNTMVGTSILSMPWAIERAGFGCGIGLMVLMGAVTLYSAYRIMKSPVKAGFDTGPSSDVEFSEICRYYLGKPGEYVSIIFSLLSLVGAAIVYWVLMTNFLYNAVTFIYNEVNQNFNKSSDIVSNYSHLDVFCPEPPEFPHHKNFSAWENDIAQVLEVHSNNGTNPSNSVFSKVWIQDKTVPLFLICILGPLVNFKSPTFFTKFNALGTVSVMYIITIVAVKGGSWGINVSFDPQDFMFYIPEFQKTFPVLTGILSLALFIHNCILSILRNQKRPENNGRDVSIAFICVTTTYLFVGVVFYVCFPLPKECIADNMLNNFHSSDVLAFTARLFLLFQMVTVFPLLLYIFRVQFFSLVFKNIYPGLLHVIILNLVLIGIAVLFAIFLPKIGVIISFSGALCGLVYIFTLPFLVYLVELRNEGRLRWPIILVHAFLMLLGVLNFVGQFIVQFVFNVKT